MPNYVLVHYHAKFVHLDSVCFCSVLDTVLDPHRIHVDLDPQTKNAEPDSNVFYAVNVGTLQLL